MATKETTYYVQETIGGWRQNAIFNGTLKECSRYLDENYHRGAYSIVSESDYKVDYL